MTRGSRKPTPGSFGELVKLAKINITRFDLFDTKENPLAWMLGWMDTESSLNQYAIRYEPKYRWLYPPDNKPQQGTTEWYAQKTSWGILQVMGAVARERGFDSKYLSELCDLRINIKLASGYLSDLRKRSDGSWGGALAAYNGGLRGNRKPPFRRQEYVDKVERSSKKYERIPSLR
ncbi:hypothetical protein LCGC14_2446400 [marine sediment metagenome]|uniref:Transglycosylase SLT domain-containing protein n=1 Tax=marine sediment metagenome TaxID=412755 RepID=A0A0F9DUK6_9ZZZZ